MAWRLPLRLVGSETTEGTSIELSAGGASMLSKTPVAAGSEVVLHMEVPDISRPLRMELPAKVVRADEWGQGEYYSALAYRDMPADQRELLRGALMQRALTRVQAIARYKVFKNLTDLDLIQLASLWHEVSLKRGEHAPRFNDRATSVFLVMRGSVELRTQGDGQVDATLMQVARPGQVFGELAAILDLPHNLDVIALEDSELLAMPRAALTYLREFDPQLGMLLQEAFTKFLGHRLSRLSAKLLAPLYLEPI